MELKTKVTAEDGKQEIFITREFDLPLELLFRAYTEPEIVEQWMGTKVLKMENKKHGGYELQMSDPSGKILFAANGVIHDFIPNQKLVRTFEMTNAPVGIQMEIHTFERLTDDTSKLTVHTIYESVAQRDQTIQFGMRPGVSMAHDRLEAVAGKLK